MKKSIKIFAWTFSAIVGLVLIVLITLSTIVYNQRDELKASLLEKANEHLVSHLDVEDITVSFLSHFPNITIVLKEVRLDKTVPSDSAVLSLKRIECVLSLPQLVQGHVSIRQLYLTDGYIDLHKDFLGVKDFDVIIPQKNKVKNPKKNLNLDIHFIKLENISFKLKDDYRSKEIHLTLKKVRIEDVHIDSNGATAGLYGHVFSHQLTFTGKTFLPGKETLCRLNIIFNKQEKTLRVNNSTIMVSNHELKVAMLIDFANDKMLKLIISNDKAQPSAMFDLLPAQYQKPIGRFQFKGDLAFKVEINTSLAPGNKPFIHVNFSSQNLSLNRTGKTNTLNSLQIKGVLSVRPIKGKLVPSIAFHSIKGKINKQDLTARALVRNFNDPILDISVKSPIQLEYLRDFFNVEKLEEARGLVMFDLNYKGSYKYLVGESSEVPYIKGHIILDSAYIKLPKIAFPFTNLTGKITFDNEYAYIDNFFVKSGHSNLKLKAKIQNLFPALLSTLSTFRLDGEFHSDNLILDDFASKEPAPALSEKEKQQAAKENKRQVRKIFELYFPSQTFIHLTGHIKSFKNERLLIKNAELEFSMENHIVELRSRGNTLSGFIDTKVSIDGKNLNAVKVNVNVNLKNIDVSQFLYSFNNFRQTLFTSDVLKGMVSGKINLTFYINKNLAVVKGAGKGKVDFEIKDGKLIKFDPLVKADNFLTKGRNLDSLSFQKIQSNLVLNNGELTLHRTAIASSAGLLYVEGTTGIDNWMSFLVTLPIKTIVKKYQPKPEELSNDAQAGPSILIRVEGPPNNLKVSFEKQKNKKK